MRGNRALLDQRLRHLKFSIAWGAAWSGILSGTGKLACSMVSPPWSSSSSWLASRSRVFVESRSCRRTLFISWFNLYTTMKGEGKNMGSNFDLLAQSRTSTRSPRWMQELVLYFEEFVVSCRSVFFCVSNSLAFSISCQCHVEPFRGNLWLRELRQKILFFLTASWGR